MAEHYRFFGGTPEDPRQYNQTEFAEVMERIFKNGIFPGVGSELKVEPTDPARMAVRVAPGQAWLRGYWYKNDDWKEIDLPPADPNYPRIHRIVLRLDTVNERKIIATVKIGTPQAVPSVPELERNDQFWELSLATVYVAAGVTSISTGDITDDRYTESCCGVAVPWDAATQKDFDMHVATVVGAHGATPSATPNTPIQRDSAGRAKVAAPAASDDIARKAEVDAALAAAQAAQATADAALPKSGGTIDGTVTINKTDSGVATVFRINSQYGTWRFVSTDQYDYIQTGQDMFLSGEGGGKLNQIKLRANSVEIVDGSLIVNGVDLFQSVSNGKNAIAAAITDMGVPATGGETFDSLASKIRQIFTGKKFASGSGDAGKAYEVTISGLDFRPFLVVFNYLYSQADQGTIVIVDGDILYVGSNLTTRYRAVRGFIASSSEHYDSASPNEVRNDGFYATVGIASYIGKYQWWAYGA